MKASTVATIAALAVSASAQLSQLPGCAFSCVTGNINPRCQLDVACNCRDAQYQAELAQCIQRSCTDPATAAQAAAAGVGICREAGITITVPGGTSSTSTAVSVTSSTSTAVTTSTSATTSVSTTVSTTVRTSTTTSASTLVTGTGGPAPTGNGTITTGRPTPTPSPSTTGGGNGGSPSSGNQLMAGSVFGVVAAVVAFML